MKTDSIVSTMAALLGARGGKSKSRKKLKAVQENLRKARAIRKLRLQTR
jgi:hypothetical protein